MVAVCSAKTMIKMHIHGVKHCKIIIIRTFNHMLCYNVIMLITQTYFKSLSQKHNKHIAMRT